MKGPDRFKLILTLILRLHESDSWYVSCLRTLLMVNGILAMITQKMKVKTKMSCSYKKVKLQNVCATYCIIKRDKFPV